LRTQGRCGGDDLRVRESRDDGTEASARWSGGRSRILDETKEKRASRAKKRIYRHSAKWFEEAIYGDEGRNGDKPS
jgi:hypothetical protein